MFSTSATLLLILFLLTFPLIGGEESGERERSSEIEATTFSPPISSTALAQAEQETVCGATNRLATVGGSKSLHSPNYPKKYPLNSECWWTITAPHHHLVQINFTAFELESYFDFLRLYDAPSKAEATQSSANISYVDVISASILSDSYYVTVKFTSNRWLQHKGFELMYRATAIKIACPTLPTLEHGNKICYVDRNDNIHCKFSCHSSLKLFGSERRWCLSNGSWTGNQSKCENKCSEQPVLENGRMRCTDGNNVGSRCNFTCNDGFELFGTESRLCRSDLSWYGRDTSCTSSPPTPTCDVDRMLICDGHSKCPDHSDEKGCTCPQSKFKCDCYEIGCQSRVGCIRQPKQCDGNNNCGDWSDERNCNCSDTRFQCKDANCIDRSKVNDGNIDCVNGDDEFVCNITQGHVKCDCMHDDDRCTSSDRCIPNSWIGDTISDCENHNDEPCNASKFWCEDCWVIIYRCATSQSKNILLQNLRDNSTRCRSVTIPSNQTQTLKINWICSTSPCGKCMDVFRCDSGQFIDNDHYCDIVPQCWDRSDEHKDRFGFRCSGNSRKGDCILPQENVYDSLADCADSSDLCFVNGEFRCFLCSDGRLIVSAKQVCDGLVDCYDMSDECLCANQTVCDAVRGEERSRCPSNQMHCRNGTDCVDMDKVLCNSSFDCPAGNNQNVCHQDQQSNAMIRCEAPTTISNDNASFWSLVTYVSAARCDGRPECGRMQDECIDCEPRSSFCESSCGAKSFAMSDIDYKFGTDVVRYIVEKPGYSYGNYICDGYDNIPLTVCDGEEEKNCPMRFYCKSGDKLSIDKRSVCDGIIDCDDHSDENSINCDKTRFYCEKGKAISINKAFVCNGIEDCDKGEDELPQLCGESAASLFSDQYEIISNQGLRALFWIMGLLTLFGNIAINIYTAKDVYPCKNNNAVKTANDIFILNLTVSDFLMGVYLIAVVTQGKIYSGFYGSVDKEWRSSSLCSGLGTLAVLSSETSVFIMASMSTFRLVTVYKPFLSSSIKMKWVVIAGCSCWIFSFLLAAIPWFPFDSGYFISDVWFPNLLFKANTISRSDMFTLAKRVSVENSNAKSWFKVKEIISKAFKYNPIKGEFGYYGETSVCMPRFYASTNEAAWEYSTFLITLNLILFVYMVIAYVLVYKKASGMKKSRSPKKDPNKEMQKRISRLLLTDFCCWIPVCIMGYLSVAGVSLPTNAYIASAGFLLPINSAMNPILYSKFIGDSVSRAKNLILQKLSCTCLCLADEADVVERRDVRVEDIELRVIEMNN